MQRIVYVVMDDQWNGYPPQAFMNINTLRDYYVKKFDRIADKLQSQTEQELLTTLRNHGYTVYQANLN